MDQVHAAEFSFQLLFLKLEQFVLFLEKGQIFVAAH